MYTTYLVVLKISSDIYIHYTPCGSYDIYWYLNKHIILSLKHLLISTLITLFHKLLSTLKPLKYLHNTLWDICWYLHYNLWSINWYLHYTLWDICWYLHVTPCNIYKQTLRYLLIYTLQTFKISTDIYTTQLDISTDIYTTHHIT